jgi:hypothetical protein
MARTGFFVPERRKTSGLRSISRATRISPVFLARADEVIE